MLKIQSSHEPVHVAATAPNDTCSLVLSNKWINDDYKHLVLKASDAACHAQPGQFFNLLCPTYANAAPFFRRPMSTYKATPDTGEVEFLYKVAGTGTAALSRLQAGEWLDMLGPLGKGFELHPSWQRIIIVARGVGLATLAPLAEAAHALNIKMTVVLSARSRQALLQPSQQRFAALGAQVMTALDDEGTSQLSTIEHTLHSVMAQQPADAMFTCGSKRLTSLLKRLTATYGIRGQTAMEEQMACGLGMCQCCAKVFEQEGNLISKRVCVDGPVFDLAEIVA